MTERTIFLAALEIADPAERRTYLDRTCAGEGALRRQVEALLAAHQRPGQFLDVPAIEQVGAALRCGEMPRAVVPSLPRVHLREPQTEPPTPVVRPGSSEMPDKAPDLPERYQLVGEIARGGMGAILKGRDTNLGRDIAVKVLLETHQNNTELVRRFLEEAQISGQLQHPGVVPVYELGQFPDQRPYFTMKLVKGRTLAVLLAERTNSPASGGYQPPDLPRFLAIFAQVCQTLAYAHARGVIHRDLKPSNVMVGSFGEVQVMDWGLAKVLAEGGIADEAKASRGHQPPEEPPTMIGTAEKAGSRTHAGSVLGTPAYMAPEQAKGEVDRLDERCDVFGLGAILCEILTGQPPYVGADSDQVWWRASRAELADARTRLDGCGTDAELIALAKRCLAAEPGERPRDAGAVAAAVTAYQDSVAERLRQAERERAAAQARAEEEKKTRQMSDAKTAAERKRRRVQLALATTVLALVLMGGGGAAWWWQQRSSAVRDVEVALAEAAAHREAGRWPQARAALERAEGRLGGAGPEALRARVQQARADANLVAELNEIRLRQAEVKKGSFKFNTLGAASQYAEVFRKYGLDVTELEPAEAAAWVRGSPIREELLAALDNWARVKPPEDPERAKLRTIADEADDNTWRRVFREAVDRKDVDKMRELAGQPEALAQPPTVLALFGKTLGQAGFAEEAAAFLMRAQPRHPADFWINHELAFTLKSMQPPRLGSAHLIAQGFGAQALAPAGAPLGALAQHLAAVRVMELDAFALPPRLEEAVGYYRAALALRPDSPGVHLNLGVALYQKGNLDAAIACYHQALVLDPNYAAAHNNLGAALRDKGDVDATITAYRQAIASDSQYAPAHVSLGNALKVKGEVDAAIVSYRQALALDSNYAKAHVGLGNALQNKGEVDAAIICYRQALSLDPESAVAHYDLGNALKAKGEVDAAIVSYRQALALDSNYAAAHNNLGVALQGKGEVDAAITAYRQAIASDPKLANAHSNLGVALKVRGDLEGAIDAFRRAIILDPKHPRAHFNLGNALRDKGDLPGAVAAYRRAIEFDPKHANAHSNLGLALRDMKDLDGAIAAWRRAIARDSKLVSPHYELGVALQARGDLDEAIAAYRQAIKLDPKLAAAHYNLGNALRDKRDLPGAVASYRQAIALRPEYAEAHCNLGLVLRSQGEFGLALAALKQGHELGSKRKDWRYPSARWVKECERLVELDGNLPALLKETLQPRDVAERLEYAQVCYWKRLYAATARLYAVAFTAEPKRADDLKAGHRYRAACAAALAGCGQGEDARELEEPERSRWRHQAVTWLRADLELWTRQGEIGKPEDRTAVQKMLQQWLRDSPLAGIRDPAALALLPSEEQQVCRKLWADVEALLTKARDSK